MDQQLNLLMTYTTFHIGLYVSLVTALLSFLTFSPKSIRRNLYPYMVVTLVCFVLAGMLGGIIASTIPRYDTYAKFENVKLGPLWADEILGDFKAVAAWEHMFFWIGILFTAGGIVWHSWPKTKGSE
jgi:hypothetical protein